MRSSTGISIERGARSTVMASPSILVVFGRFRQSHGWSFSGAANLTFFRRRLLAHPANRRAPSKNLNSFPQIKQCATGALPTCGVPSAFFRSPLQLNQVSRLWRFDSFALRRRVHFQTLKIGNRYIDASKLPLQLRDLFVVIAMRVPRLTHTTHRIPDAPGNLGGNRGTHSWLGGDP